MNFGLVDLDRDDLIAHFPELHAASANCPEHCTHDAEPNCALLGLTRLFSYRRILNSLALPPKE